MGAFDGSTLSLNDNLPRVLEACAPEHKLAVKLVLCCASQMSSSQVVRSANPTLFDAPIELQTFLRSKLESSQLPQTAVELAEMAGRLLERELIVPEQAESVKLAKEIKKASQLEKVLKALIPDEQERVVVDLELKAIEVRRYYRRRYVNLSNSFAPSHVLMVGRFACLHRYDAGSQKKLIITTETHTILEQFDSIGLERLSELIASKDLKAFCSWMARSIDGVARFSALKVGGSMMFAGELLQNDYGPALGDDEGASTCLRCLVHAVSKAKPNFPTWYTC